MHKTLSRRTLLTGSGVAMALPLLESMSPAFGAPRVPPRRMIFICTTLGLHPPFLWPTTTGAGYETTPYLELLKEHRDDFTLMSGLQHDDQVGRQPHDSEMTWLTSARKPGVGGFRNTISVDQVAAATSNNQTRFPSITLGTMSSKSQSYTGGGVMIPAETSPANLFAQLFLQGTSKEVQAQRHKLSDGKSILDRLGSQAKSLRRKASVSDNHLLDDYFSSVRAAEANITAAQGWLDRPKPQVDARQPTDIPDNRDLIGRAQLLMDLAPLIVQTDSTRVISIMIQDHFVVPIVKGVTTNHHHLSHHGQEPAKIAQLKKIETGILNCFSRLLGELKARRETGSRLLDHTSVLFGSNLGNANAHHTKNLPVFLAGGGFNHGQYIAHKEGTPLCNLFVAMLNHMGIETDAFGQSTGKLNL